TSRARMPLQPSGKAVKKAGKAQKIVRATDKEKKRRTEEGELQRLHLQGAQTGPPRHRSVQQGH
ncbi:hypothetical protein HPB47_010956, partial [Ixodes persulcatus]